MSVGFRTLRAYLNGPPRVSQRALAEQAGVNQSMISMLASGKRCARGPLAVRLNEITGVPLKALITVQPARRRAA